MIFLNFKTYETGSGEKAVLMAKIAQEVSQLTGVKIISVVQATDIKEVVTSVATEVWAQKVDSITYGPHTGGILPEAVYEDGASGVFLNHSENSFVNFDELKGAFDRATVVGLKTLIFAKDVDILEKITVLKPNYISYEPPSLIGSRDLSVVTASSQDVIIAVDIARRSGVPLIVGAGVHSQEDVRKSLQLGAIGIAVASDIMLAQDPKSELLDLARGFV